MRSPTMRCDFLTGIEQARPHCESIFARLAAIICAGRNQSRPRSALGGGQASRDPIVYLHSPPFRRWYAESCYLPPYLSQIF